MASGYFWAAPVLKITTCSSGWIQFSSRSCSSAPMQAAVSGQMARPSDCMPSAIHSRKRASGTATARPPLARTASRIMKSPTAAGTRMPLAIVAAPANGSANRSPSLEGPDDRRAAVRLHGHHPRPLVVVQPA